MAAERERADPVGYAPLVYLDQIYKSQRFMHKTV